MENLSLLCSIKYYSVYFCLFLLWFQLIAYKVYLSDKPSQCWPEISVGRSFQWLLLERRSFIFSPGNMWPAWEQETWDRSLLFFFQLNSSHHSIVNNKHSVNIDEQMDGYMVEWMNVRNSQILLGHAWYKEFGDLFLPWSLTLILADSQCHNLHHCSNTWRIGRSGSCWFQVKARNDFWAIQC